VTERLAVIPTGFKDHGTCPCCGGHDRSAWGEVQVNDITRAVYHARHMRSKRHDGIIFLFSIGTWHVADAPNDRQSVGLHFRIVREQPGFMVIDATDTPWGGEQNVFLGTKLTREQVVGTPLAATAFSFADRVISDDDRVIEFIGEEAGRKSSVRLAPDHTPVPLNGSEADPFRFEVTSVFAITNRGLVASGLVRAGRVKVGDSLRIEKGAGPWQITGVEFADNIAARSSRIGLLFQPAETEAAWRALVAPGTILVKPDDDRA
jgi:hypothetical protein